MLTNLEFGWNETAEDEDVNNDGAMTVKVERNVTEEHKTFKCKSCGKDYKNQKCYEKHVPCRRKTDAERVKSYYWEKVKLEPKQCLTCGDMLASSSALKLHIRSIHDEVNFIVTNVMLYLQLKGTSKSILLVDMKERLIHVNFVITDQQRRFSSKGML